MSKIKASTDSAVVLCEEGSCADYMNLAKRSGMFTVECIYSQLCCKCPYYNEKTDLSVSTLQHLSSKGKVKLFFDQTIWMSKQLYESVQCQGSRLTVPVQNGDHYIYKPFLMVIPIITLNWAEPSLLLTFVKTPESVAAVLEKEDVFIWRCATAFQAIRQF